MASPKKITKTRSTAESDLHWLRAEAISHTLFRPTTLKSALRRLGFVQADPIRSPARAQDLILRHRVKGYHAGDLARRYSSLDIEEDVLYAYGFLSRSIWQLLHPRCPKGLPELEMKVLSTVRRYGEMHPKELEAHFGNKRVVNAWGGYSRATKRALERLHYCGLLRIARRENSVRIYAEAPPLTEVLSPAERFGRLLLAIANVLAPVQEKTLQSIAAPLRRSVPGVADHRVVLRELINSGKLERHSIGGLAYLFISARKVCEIPPRCVRFLAPFDPLIWDRRRFEHLWQWPYRFEAYTPPAKRIRGYYAMPLLWGDSVIGWANAKMSKNALSFDLGFVDKRPRDSEFRRELDAEIARMEAFIDPCITQSSQGSTSNVPITP